MESSLADARQAEDSEAVAIYARNAGIISSNAGELKRAIGFYSEAIESQPEVAYLRIALADLHEQSGEVGAAREEMSKCREIAHLKKDRDILAILRKRGFDPGTGA